VYVIVREVGGVGTMGFFPSNLPEVTLDSIIPDRAFFIVGLAITVVLLIKVSLRPSCG
jgi:hypothetical protein